MKQIYIVDDDESLLRALGRLLRIDGFDVVPFESPNRFLQSLETAEPGCVIADLKMPEMSGIEMYEAMKRAGCTFPVIFLTGKGAIPDSVTAMKRGAVNFLTKPATREALLAAVEEAFKVQEAQHQEDFENAQYRRRFESLSPREREVCFKVTRGFLNKQIAGDLGVTEKTIKVHRQHVMVKMKAGSLAELVRIVARLENGQS